MQAQGGFGKIPQSKYLRPHLAKKMESFRQLIIGTSQDWQNSQGPCREIGWSRPP